ncbi:MAG: PadR family transcriptional regulator [Ornithinibacter sp.]
MSSRRAHLLEFAVLGLLHEGPTHGYDLRRRLNTALGPFRALSYGTLYPALKGLLGRGLIAETPDPLATGKRPRVVYELTATGKEHFADMVARTDATAYDEDGFDVRFAFFTRTERDVRIRILEGRRSRVQEDLERVRETAARNRERIDAYTSALQQHGEETTEREVRWLSELIDAERRHPSDPGPQP